MKTNVKNKIVAEAQSANFFEKFQPELCGFTFRKIFDEDGDKFKYFTYENIALRRSLTTYFHEETMEYKVNVKVGLTEFCLTKFFTGNFSDFNKMLDENLEKNLSTLGQIRGGSESGEMIREKKISDWQYGKNLPKNSEGFELFIAPADAVKYTNGSYIIINYVDFDNESDLKIYYNVYGDIFSGESSIKNVPHVNYLFDAENLKELEQKLEKNLVPELKRIRAEI